MMGAEFAALWLASANGQRWQRGHAARTAARHRVQTARARVQPTPAQHNGSAAGGGASGGVGAYFSGGLLAASNMLLGGPDDAAADASALAPPRDGEQLSFAFPNGDRYTGGWRDGLRHGCGVGSLGAAGGGGKYEGAWRGDVWHGDGVFTSGEKLRAFFAHTPARHGAVQHPGDMFVVECTQKRIRQWACL